MSAAPPPSSGWRGALLIPLPYAHEREVGVFWKKTDWTHEEYLYIRGRVPGFRAVALYRQRDGYCATVTRRPAWSAASRRPPSSSTCWGQPLLGRGFRTVMMCSAPSRWWC